MPQPLLRSSSGDPNGHRPIKRETKFHILLLLLLAAAALVGMYLVEHTNKGQAELLKSSMEQSLSADKILLKILKNFSVKTVEDHIFHGILPKKEKVSIEFRGLSTTIKGSGSKLPCFGPQEDIRILTGVSGKFEAGHVAAIMGTSGAGKTTFLNVLCGKIGAMGNWEVTGQVFINGVEKDLSSLKSVMGFVPQDDIVHEAMTVRENLHYSAQLRNVVETSRSRLRRITDDVLQVLQLGPQQNVVVGNRATGSGLSGGQRKRVNVGLELAACPTLLFLDEPTSGLDATGSLILVRQLQKMTQLGMTVIMVVHQPRYGLFTLIDDVLLLGKGGKTVYIGPTHSAKPYFENMGFCMPPNENPADWMMDVMSGQQEIDNPRISKEEIPNALYKEWSNTGEAFVKENSESGAGIQRAVTRSFSKHDDAEVIKSHLKEVWRKVEPSLAMPVLEEKLSRVLSMCTGAIPEERVIDQLLTRIGNAAKHGSFKDEHVPGTVTHHEFEQYLLAIHRGGARLRQMNTATNLPGLSDFEEDEDQADSEDSDDDSYESSVESDEGDSEAQLNRRRTPDKTGATVARKSTGARKSNDLWRELPGFWAQLGIIVQRRSIVWWRRQQYRLMFMLVVEFAAVFLGITDRFIFKTPAWYPTNYMNCFISLTLLTSAYMLQTFGNREEMPVYWREVSHGLNRLAFFIGRSIVDIVDLFLMCFGFATMYYVVAAPDIYFAYYMVPFIFTTFVASGWGYIISCWLPYQLTPLGPFVSALLSFVFGGILGLPSEMHVFLSDRVYEIVVDCLAFTRWGVAMMFFEYIHETPQNVTQMDFREHFFYDNTQTDYDLATIYLPGDKGSYWWSGILAMTVMGVVLRLGAFAGLCLTNRAKQV